MTDTDIEKFKMCEEFLSYIRNSKGSKPVKQQKYGCGTGRPPIEFTLEKVNRNMYNSIMKVFDDAEKEVKEIISGI